MAQDIWILVQHRKGAIEEVTFGLIGEAQRLLSELGGGGTVTAVALGFGLEAELESLGACGADKVIYIESDLLRRYQGELFVEVLFKQVKRCRPSHILMAHTMETADLSARLAALLQTGLVTRAVDSRIDEHGATLAIRPVANGYLFEEMHFVCESPLIVSFLPSVLSAPEPGRRGRTEILTESMDEPPANLKTEVVEIMEAEMEELDLEEADIIVSGGRGVGRHGAFNIIHELARSLGGSVGGTRPVIDCQTLPFERQIGQTGKTVAPRLIFACGISGANEFTAGMEKSQLIIVINTDPRARIFRLADLGVIGDVHEVVPVLIERLKGLRD